MKSDILQKVEKARNSREYKIYLKVSDGIIKMVDEMYKRKELPSDYWEEEITGFEYIFDASPLIIKLLRHHCYHITGLRSYDYRQHHIRYKTKLQEKYELLKRFDPSFGLFVAESPMLGGFGFKDGGFMYNVDTLKFYESILTLYYGGFLGHFLEAEERKTVLEIGGGWGGLAYQFRTLFPNTTYVIIDLPQTLLFSAVYLQVLFPEAKCLIYNEPKDAKIDKNYDFIFLPHFSLSELSASLDLTINTVSFQEMSKDQVDSYCKKVYQLGCPRIYSYNRYQNLNNLRLGILTTIIEKYYRLELFEASFIQNTRREVTKEVNFKQMIKVYLRENILTRRVYGILRQLKNKELVVPDKAIDNGYRHYLGTRN